MASTFMISSSTPTGNNRRIELAGMDLWLSARIDNVYVYPDEIKIDQLKEALGQTLSLWPLVTGRILLENDQHYFIEMCDNSIPITVSDNHDLIEWPFDANVIVEADNQLFQTFIDFVPVTKLLPNSFDEPLVRLKLTHIIQSNEWILGVSWYHALGDADACLRFSNTFSRFYQQMDPILPLPIFERRLWQEHEVQQSFLPIPKQFLTAQSNEEFVKTSHNLELDYEPINIHFSGEQLTQLKVLTGKTNVTIHDALIAYITLTLNKYCYKDNDERRILHTITVANYRGMDDSIAPRGEVSNALFMMLSDNFDDPYSFLNIAQTIRRSLLQLRDSKILANGIATIDRFMRDNAKSSKRANRQLTPNEIAINSNFRYDWADLVDFGYKDQCRFYTCGSRALYLRVFRLNPEKYENKWLPRDRNGAEVSFRLEKDKIEIFLNAFKRDINENFQNIY
ncbi:hypothetical protein I4U23_003534 [Adineta vaga]|nr:hypothetical protein I4U23_003534 [Adineta vaga]